MPSVGQTLPLVPDTTRIGDVVSSVAPAQRSAKRGAGQAAARQRRLGTSASRSEKKEVGRAEKRRVRRRLRQLGGELAGAQWLKDCGRKSVVPGGGVAVRGKAGEVAGFAGVMHCGSVHSCPECAAKIGAHRAEELAQVIGWAREQGHTVALLTLTTRHRKGQRLDMVWDRVQAGWETVTSGWISETEKSHAQRVQANADAWALYEIARASGMKTRRPKSPEKVKPRRIGAAEKAGMLGWARAVEATEGANGWHVHLHVLVVLEGHDGDQVERVARLESAVFALWEKGIKKTGGSVEREPGADMRIMYGNAEQVLSAYLTKAGDALASAAKLKKSAQEVADQEARSMAAETTLGAFKKGRRTGNRTPFEMLANIDATGDLEDEPLWREWVHTSRGRRALTWSAGLRELAGLAAEEKTDEEIAEEETGGEDLLFLPRDSWLMIRDDQDRCCDLLESVERGGFDAATDLLDRWRVPWVIPVLAGART